MANTATPAELARTAPAPTAPAPVPGGAVTAVSGADAAAFSAARANAAAGAAWDKAATDYLHIVEGAKQTLQPLRAIGWTDGQILNEAFNIANKAWVQQFATKPPGL
jgi:hypothetical protein